MADNEEGSSAPAAVSTPKKNNQKKPAKKTPTTKRLAQTATQRSPGSLYGSLPIRSATPTPSEAAPPATAPPDEAADSIKPDVAMASPQGELKLGHIDGLQSMLHIISGFLMRFNPKFADPIVSSGALVIEGGAGTGKTMLLDRIAATGWGNVFRIDPTDKLSTMQEIFAAASAQHPSIVIMDGIQHVLSEDRNNRLAVVRAIGTFLDKIAAPLTAQVVMLVSCQDYLKDIPQDLRKPGRLIDRIKIPFPDPESRKAILRSFKLPLPPGPAGEELLNYVVKLTNAFNGHDLRFLYIKAMDVRFLQRSANGTTDDSNRYLERTDFEQARVIVKPSLMDGINLKPRPVYWNQIHGQDRMVAALKQRIDMANKPGLYTTHFDSFPRGFLLYGPPGCSKTMAAQALATESDLNYFSVKGAELLNQYVGETERAIRDLFERARLASPSVIFLDEIDALGGRRSNFGDRSTSSTRGPQMVPALLSEMDGFEPLDKVIVLAATNRPEAVDPALLRPGRFDKCFYVAPPNLAARRSIIEAQFEGKLLSPDLDPESLAADMDGFSGAEIIGICRNAFEKAFDEDRALLRTEHMQTVIKSTAKTVTKDMLDHFSRWRPEYY